MLRVFSLLILLFANLGWAASEAKWQSHHDFLREAGVQSIRSVPVMHEGRIKPFDTFARTHLLAFSGKSRLGPLQATEWLTILLLDPNSLNDERTFHVTNPDLVATLKLSRHVSNRYSFREIFPKIQENLPQIRTVSEIPADKRTPEQSQLMQVQAKVGRYYEIASSMQAVLPRFSISDADLAREFMLDPGKNYNFLAMNRLSRVVRDMAASLPEIESMESLTGRQKDIVRLAGGFAEIEAWIMSPVLRILPPQWQTDSAEWLSIWDSVSKGAGSPKSAKYIERWKTLAENFSQRNAEGFASAAAAIGSMARELGPVDHFRLRTEVFYNRAQFDVWAIAAFLISLFAILIHWTGISSRFAAAASGTLIFGMVTLAVAISIRMYLMARPPVATLYESIIFVAFIVAVFGYWMERRIRNGLGILVGSSAAVLLLFVSFGYAAEGDTLGVLVAVLNTNFWLATHVVCMTIGYGTCLVAGLLGHVYLFARSRPKTKIRLNDLYKNMVGMSLIALFFSMFGTILGGIWADQSWGRFWGWDPKENGALLVVLWLLLLLHGRLGGQVRALGYALGMVLSNIIVALAWFGVNLLSVGLHSYGFTDNIAINLLVFCLAELFFGLTFYHFAKMQIMRNKVEELETNINSRSRKLVPSQ